jgi:hypothetical protein
VNICGKGVQVQGRLIRIARLDGEKYNSPDDPELILDGLRRCGARIDIFTFLRNGIT